MWRIVLAIAATLAVVLALAAASAARLTVNGDTLQVFSYAADIETPPTAPNGLQATYHHSMPTVDLTWQPTDDAKYYDAYRGATAGGPYERIGSTQVESYADTEIVEGHTYCYVVTAVDASGLESQPSNEAAVLIAVATPAPATTPAPTTTPESIPSPTPMPEATSTPTSDLTAPAQPTPEPTSTPEVTPTPTPEPTAGPEPGPEPTPTATPEPTPLP